MIHPYFFLWPDVFEEVLEIVSYITTFSPTISLEMWSLWPLMMQGLVDWAIDFFPSMKLPVSVFFLIINFHSFFLFLLFFLDRSFEFP